MRAESWTKVFIQVDEGYIAYVEELPGANTQGDTFDEAFVTSECDALLVAYDFEMFAMACGVEPV